MAFLHMGTKGLRNDDKDYLVRLGFKSPWLSYDIATAMVREGLTPAPGSTSISMATTAAAAYVLEMSFVPDFPSVYDQQSSQATSIIIDCKVSTKGRIASMRCMLHWSMPYL